MNYYTENGFTSRMIQGGVKDDEVSDPGPSPRLKLFGEENS